MPFEYEGILIPSEVTPANEDNLAWCLPLFKKLAETTASPAALWTLLFETVFLDERWTENHKYQICIVASAEIVKMYMEMEYGEIIHAYDTAMSNAQNQDMFSMTPELILPPGLTL